MSKQLLSVLMFGLLFILEVTTADAHAEPQGTQQQPKRLKDTRKLNAGFWIKVGASHTVSTYACIGFLQQNTLVAQHMLGGLVIQIHHLHCRWPASTPAQLARKQHA